MPPVLLATCAALPDGDEDADLLLAALATRGVDARFAVWTSDDVDWTSALAVLRSTWDYTADRDGFLRWAGAVPRLANPVDVVRWNTDKVYLRDLAEAGVPTVPTVVLPPGTAPVFDVDGEVVVKPSVGAGSRGAGRFAPGRGEDARAHAVALQQAGRTALVQPYLADVDTAGETALIYVDGTFSHAVRKAALLPDGVTHPVDGWQLYVEEKIEPREAQPAELAVGAAALAAVRERFGADLLYARVDLLPGPDGPLLVELELTEPSLFLQHAPGAADRFAAAVAERA